MPLLDKIGWLAFLGVVGHRLASHGRRWEFASYGIPRSFLGTDGTTYADGTSVDPVSLAIIRSGYEPLYNLVAIAAVAAILTRAVSRRDA